MRPADNEIIFCRISGTDPGPRPAPTRTGGDIFNLILLLRRRRPPGAPSSINARLGASMEVMEVIEHKGFGREKHPGCTSSIWFWKKKRKKKTEARTSPTSARKICDKMPMETGGTARRPPEDPGSFPSVFSVYPTLGRTGSVGGKRFRVCLPERGQRCRLVQRRRSLTGRSLPAVPLRARWGRCGAALTCKQRALRCAKHTTVRKISHEPLHGF